MKFFTEKRFVYQQPPQPNPEVQSQPPVETGKEAPNPLLDTNKEALPTDPKKISDEYAGKGRQNIASANDKLTVFENLKVG